MSTATDARSSPRAVPPTDVGPDRTVGRSDRLLHGIVAGVLVAMFAATLWPCDPAASSWTG